MVLLISDFFSCVACPLFILFCYLISPSPKTGKGGRKLAAPFDFHENKVSAEVSAPWSEPDHAKAELIVPSPGIWKIPDFLSIDEVLVLKESLDDEAEDGRFENCVGYGIQNQLDCKKCFRLTLDNCRDDECPLLSKIFERIRAIWPTESPQSDYLYVQRHEPGCSETKFHVDVTDSKTAAVSSTQVLYLSNGGGKVYFPNALPQKTAVEPVAGTLLTWLNVHPDGTENEAAYHGVEANPMDADIRYSLGYRVHFDEHKDVGVGQRRLCPI